MILVFLTTVSDIKAMRGQCYNFQTQRGSQDCVLLFQNMRTYYKAFKELWLKMVHFCEKIMYSWMFPIDNDFFTNQKLHTTTIIFKANYLKIKKFQNKIENNKIYIILKLNHDIIITITIKQYE